MSQDFQDPELFADFIIEAKEHLETIEPNLLELEKAPDNLGLLNDIFRPMHSLKGASGFLGLNHVNHLAHKAENILDELRKGTMVITSEIMDIILAVTDALRQMIENLERINSEGDVEYDALIEVIDAIMRGETPVSSVVPEEPAEEITVEEIFPAKELLGEPIIMTPEEAEIVHDEELDALEAALDQAMVEAGFEIEPTTQTDENITSILKENDFDRKRSEDKKQSLPPKEWIAQLLVLPRVTLTAFGEGHLKDFMDEVRENIENINTYLLELEKNPNVGSELVNDLFRYFHNIKGNSGIIDFKELNSLTHEAETLLNKVRHGEQIVTHELVDLLLLVADVMDSLIDSIDISTGTALPFLTEELIVQLQKSIAGEEIALPASILYSTDEAEEEPEVKDEPQVIASPQTEEKLLIKPIGSNRDDDEDDISMFQSTVNQQKVIIQNAMHALNENSEQKDKVDAIFRSITAIEKSASFMGYDEVNVYANRTAGLVDQARKSGIDFGLMLDILRQEVAIIYELIDKAVTAASAILLVEPAQFPDPAVEPPHPPYVHEEAPVVPSTPAKPVEPIQKIEKTLEPPQTSAATVAPKAETPKQDAPKADAPKAVAAPAVTPKQEVPKPVTAPKAEAPKAAQTSAPKAEAPKPVVAPKIDNAPAQVESKTSSTIRVDHEKLDHLMNLIGELLINRNRYTMLARQLEEKGKEINLADMAQNLSETTYAMARISDDLQATIMKVRMVPVSSVFSRFPRLVRDLSRKSGKDVDLILEGEETELDKSVVEVIGDPLVHLIRNSVDHGVESEEERLAKGKPAKGRVVLRAYHKGNSVAIEIEDDGKGIDPDKMREVAIKKGLITPEEAKNMDDKEAVELIFAPGFSSADQITDISGRGVGMDVVRTNIKNLKGSVNTFTELGKGTRFTLSLPLTLAIIDALMVNVAGQTYAIPLDAVSGTTKLETALLTDIKGKKAVTFRGDVLGIVEMTELLNLPKKEKLPDMLPVVIIHDNDRLLGIVVDRLLERQEIVIKPLGAYLLDIKGISGATIMGDGSVILILDPHEIYSMATSKSTQPAK